MYSKDVPAKTVKANADLFSIFVSNVLNEFVISSTLLSVLKLADVKPVHKKNQGFKKRTIEQLVYYLSFQKFLKDAYMDIFQNILRLCYQNFQCGFWKGYSTQDCLLAMVENCKKTLDQGINMVPF